MMPVVLPLLLLWLGGAGFFLADGRGRKVAAAALTLLAAAVSAAVVLLFAAVVDGPRDVVTGGWPAGVGIRLRADALGGFFTVLSLLGLFCALAVESVRGIRSRSFPALVLLLGAGLTGLFLTADVFNFYVFFEISMLASFALAAYGEDPKEIRAAVVFALVNLVGSAFFLGAVGAVYRLAGTLDMAQVSDAVAAREEPASLVATLMFVALALKVGIFPLHFWLPAVYRGTRPVVAAVLAGAVANIGTYGLIRLGLGIFPDTVEAARPVLLGLGAASVLYGALLASSRRLVSEVLGYSAIGQAGYVLIAVAVGGTVGIAAAVIYAGVNSLNKTLLFLVEDTPGPAAATLFAVGAFSVVGVPPTVGFAGKVELFRVAVAEQSLWIGGLVLLGSALSFVYVFQAYQHTYWVAEEERDASHAAARAGVGLLAAVVVGLGLWPEPLLVASRAAAAVVGGAP